jgi:hypothetical protein
MKLGRTVREMNTRPEKLDSATHSLTGVKVPIFFNTRWVVRNTKMGGKACRFGKYGR